jgi:hypothetical protein
VKRQLTIVLAVGVLVALVAAWFHLTFERAIKEEVERPSAEAMRNQFLAAERLLAESGVEVRRIDGLEGELDLPAGSVLVVPAGRGVVSERALARLERFVRQGGHLLVESEPLDQVDLLLQRFAIERSETDDHVNRRRWRNSWSPWRRELTTSTDRRGLRQTDPSFGEPLLRVRQQADYLLQAEQANWWLGEPDAAQALQLQAGQGRVTAVVDLSVFGNWQIGHFDHAEWLHRLLLADAAPASVAFVRAWRGGLGRWLLDEAWRVLLAGALLLLALLWAAMPRFGPLLAEPEPARRRLLDHLAASGRLLWSRGERAALARAAVEAALARVRSEYPHTAAMSQETLAAFLCRRCGLDRDQAQALLAPSMPSHPLSFLYLLRACRRIHLLLAAGQRSPSRDALFES